MTEPLKLGIPDDEAATAPSRKFRLKERKPVWLPRLLVPFALAVGTFFANKLVAKEVIRSPEDEDQGPLLAMDEPESGPELSRASSDLEPVIDSGETNSEGASNVVSFSDHPVTAVSRVSKSFHETDDNFDTGQLTATLPSEEQRGDSDLQTTTDGTDFLFAESSKHAVRAPTERIVQAQQGKESDRRTDNGPVPKLGTHRTNETMVLTTAMLLSYASDLDGDYLSVADVQADNGTVTSVGEEMWLFVPTEGYEGDVSIQFSVSDGVETVHKAVAVSYADSVEDTEGTEDADHVVTTVESEDVNLHGAGDTAYTREGDDIVLGHEGDDRLIGGKGDDTIYGGEGDDHIFGRDGDDVILGQSGDDTAYGGEGNDIILGGAGNDYLFGNEGSDRLLGGDGEDYLFGGLGSDYIDAGSGDDWIEAVGFEVAGDVVHGGEGTDSLVFTSTRMGVKADLKRGIVTVGDETAEISDIENIFVDSGDDELIANDSANIFSGGDGADRFVFESVASLKNNGHARDLILDFEPGDKIDLSMLSNELGILSGISLKFAGLGAPSALGALSYFFEQKSSGKDKTVVSVQFRSDDDDDDDDDIDYLALEILGQQDLDASDFILKSDEAFG